MSIPISAPCCVIVLNQQQQQNTDHYNNQSLDDNDDRQVKYGKTKCKNCTVVENGRVVVRRSQTPIDRAD